MLLEACSVAGNAHHGLGQYAEAQVCHRRALDIATELEDRGAQCSAWEGLGLAAVGAGRMVCPWSWCWLLNRGDAVHRNAFLGGGRGWLSRLCWDFKAQKKKQDPPPVQGTPPDRTTLFFCTKLRLGQGGGGLC